MWGFHNKKRVKETACVYIWGDKILPSFFSAFDLAVVENKKSMLFQMERRGILLLCTSGEFLYWVGLWSTHGKGRASSVRLCAGFSQQIDRQRGRWTDKDTHRHRRCHVVVVVVVVVVVGGGGGIKLHAHKIESLLLAGKNGCGRLQERLFSIYPKALLHQ